MPILLVRHATAGQRDAWEGDDRLRPLDDRGWRQAEGLVAQLARFPVERVLSSPYLRCVQTVEPLARARGLTVEESDALAEGHAEDAVALATGLAGTATVLCTHGDLVPPILDAFLPGQGHEQSEKGSTWVLGLPAAQSGGHTYLPPPG